VQKHARVFLGATPYCEPAGKAELPRHAMLVAKLPIQGNTFLNSALGVFIVILIRGNIGIPHQ
jgi:hypothetical protein